MDTNDNAMVALSKAQRGGELAVTLDAMAEELQAAWLTQGNFARTVAYGLAVGKMREALSEPVMRSLLKLKNCKLGFRTDESAQNVYSVEVVRDAVIDAVTLGLQCVGNQFNIIGGNMYVTKEGFTFLLRQLSAAGRLKDLRLIYHPAVISESSTQGTRRDGSLYQKVEREGKVCVDVSWCFDGVPGRESLEFVVRVNAGMSQDAIIGKAERKAKAWLYNFLTDQAISDGDAEGEADGGAMRDVTRKQDAMPMRAGLPGHGLKAAAQVVCAKDEAAATPAERLHPELHDEEAQRDVFAGMWTEEN